MAADAAERKNDIPKALTYAQSALDADPKNYEAMLLMSGELARTTREHDLDLEEKLTRADKLAHDAWKPSTRPPSPTPACPTINGKPTRRTKSPKPIPTWV